LTLGPLTRGEQRVVTDLSQLMAEAEFNPQSLYLVWMADAAWIEAHPGALEKFDAMLSEAYERLAEDDDIWTALAEKVGMLRHLSPANLDPKHRGMDRGRTATQVFQLGTGEPVRRSAPPPVAAAQEDAPLLLIGASTGGPTALVELFGRLPRNAQVVVAQHMPERFTKTFAERLDRISPLRVVEGQDTVRLEPGVAVICPGGRCVEVAPWGQGLIARVLPPDATDRYVPSVDRLFSSGAAAVGERAVAVVLTGMGDDGAHGVTDVKRLGGTVLAEAPETAVIYGMPGAAVRTGEVDRSLPLRALAERIAGLWQ
ncbi:MAG: CheB methylesterase domain-containing protein, partial [Myxococcota bacterium]